MTISDEKDWGFFVDYLNKNPYTTPDGRVLSGEEGALEFIRLFFPEEVEKMKNE
jgi:hypothetical protein